MSAAAPAKPPLVVDRVHLLSEDLAWAPPLLTRVQRLISASLVVGASVPAFLKLGPMVVFVPVVVAPVALRLGNRAARTLARRRLARYAHGDVDLSRLGDEVDGELLHVRGRVRARSPLRGLIDDEQPAVYRRVQVQMGSLQVVHEAAVDFALVDDDHQQIAVLARDARLLGPPPPRYRVSGEDEQRLLAEVMRPSVLQELRTRGIDHFETLAGEILVCDGDVVNIVGYKTRVVDQTVEHRLLRDEPYRAALRSGAKLPLLIAVSYTGSRCPPASSPRSP